jgi:hypothetical protein
MDEDRSAEQGEDKCLATTTQRRRVAAQNRKHLDGPGKKQSGSHAYRASISLAYLAST